MEKDIIAVIGMLEKIEFNYADRDDFPHTGIEDALGGLRDAVKELDAPIMGINNEYAPEKHGREQV